MNEIENVVVEESKVWETFSRDQIEQIIQGNIRAVDEKMGQMVQLFVTTGYYLRRQYREKMYLDAGYDRFEDYVKDRYGRSRSWATRMIEINEEYSIGGDDPRIDPRYIGYSISKLQEMMYLTDAQRQQVTPDMTVKEIRALKAPAPVEEDQLPGQMSVEDYPEVMPEQSDQEEVEDDEELLCDTCMNVSSLTGNPDLCQNCARDGSNYKARCITGKSESGHCGAAAYCNEPVDCCAACEKDCNSRCGWLEEEAVKTEVRKEKQDSLKTPTPSEMEIMRSLARKLIESMRDWFAADYHSRVLDVDSGSKVLREYVSISAKRYWYFVHNTDVCHANLFDDYIQLWNGTERIGNFDWFYLSASIQVVWGVLAMEEVEKSVATSQKSLADRYYAGEISKEELWNGQATGGNAAELQRTEGQFCESAANEVEDTAEVVVEPVPLPADTLTTGTTEPPDEVIDAEYTEVTEEITITPQSVLKDAQYWLEEYIKCDAPKNLIEKQKILVAALASMVCDLEEVDPQAPEQPELPVMKNNDQRKEWLRDYKAWGVWYYDENIDVYYYKYDFDNGDRLIVAEYPNRGTYWYGSGKTYTAKHYHLLEAKRQCHGGGTYNHKFTHDPDSETYLVDYLKRVTKK